MKRTTLLIMLFAALHISTSAQQNLVPNPSFEEYINCPTMVGDFTVSQWSSYRESPDYFNRCVSDSLIYIPCNGFGCQEPATGNGYIGMHTITFNSNSREIVGVQLTKPLVIGQVYYMSFKVSPAYGGYFGVKWFASKLGIKFSTVEHSVSIDNIAHIYSNEIIVDTSIWTIIQGVFIADSSYKYLMLGNFFDDTHTDTIVINGIYNSYTYYYVDDVCVTTNPNGCDFTSTIHETEKSNIVAYPNPASNILYVDCQDMRNSEITLLDITGRQAFVNGNCSNNRYAINVSELPSGTYILKIKDKSNFVSKKIFINH